MYKAIVLGVMSFASAVALTVGCSSNSPASSSASDAGLDGSKVTSDANATESSTTSDAGVGAPTDGGDAAMANVSDAGEGGAAAYLMSLPAWPAPQPDSMGVVDGGADAGSGPNYLTGTDGKKYQCTTTQYSLTTTPSQIVTFNPNVDVLWPGALLQGGPLLSGSLVGLPITQRSPLAVSIPTLLSANNTLMVQNPTEATVEQAVGQLINAAVVANVQPSSSISYTETQVHSSTQAALSLGISANYLGASFSASFNMSSSANLNTIMGYFVQNMFTVTVPEPEQPSDFFSGLTQDEINQQMQEGNIGPTNLPVYVASVTYGRILTFTITSSESTSDIEAALNAAYQGGVGGVSGNAAYSNLLSEASTSVQILTVGGSASDAEKMIQSGNPSDFFSSDPAISSGVPISYTLRNLGNNSIASVSETTSYGVQTCAETAMGPGANVYVLNGDGTILGFDFTGTSVALTGLTGPLSGANGLAYDGKADQLYVSFPGQVYIIAPDGSPIAQPVAPNWGGLTGINSISYDPLYDRLYLPTPPQGVSSFTSGGSSIEQYAATMPFGAAFDPYNQWLYTTDESASTIQAFHLNGTPVGTSELAMGGVAVDAGAPDSGGSGADAGNPGPAFGGLMGPDQIVYDSQHDMLYVSSGGANSVLSFHPNGQPAGSFLINNGSTGLAYDDVNDHLLVIDGNDGLVMVFNPDGTRVQEAPGAFSGLAHAFRVAVRP